MKLPVQAPIIYRDFYDVPRIFVVLLDGTTLLMDCVFNEASDEYSDVYEVYRMRPNFEPPEGSWESLTREGAERLGSIPVSAVRFDPTRRCYIETEVLRTLTDFAGSE